MIIAIAFHPGIEGISDPSQPNPYALAGAAATLEMVLNISGGLLALGFIGSVAALSAWDWTCCCST